MLPHIETLSYNLQWLKYNADDTRSSQQVYKQSPDGERKYHSDILGGSVLLTLEPLAFSTACLAEILQPYSWF